MNYNPYAPPTASAPDGGVPPRGDPQPWEIGEVFKAAWALYTAQWAPLTLGYLFSAVVGSIPQEVAPVLAMAGLLREGSRTYYAIHVPLALVGALIAQFFAAGFVRAALRAVRGGEASFGDFFAEGSRFVAFSVTVLLSLLASFVGLLFFVVPGFIVMLGFSNAPYFVVDQKLGPIAALEASWEAADGQKGHLLSLWFVELGVVLLGLLACCLGFFVAVPVMTLVRAIVYTRMAGTAPAPELTGATIQRR